MATYAAIANYVKKTAGWTLHKPCWVAHCKELNGLPVRIAWNRRNPERKVLCPSDKRLDIENAFRHFGMIDC